MDLRPGMANAHDRRMNYRSVLFLFCSHLALLSCSSSESESTAKDGGSGANAGGSSGSPGAGAGGSSGSAGKSAGGSSGSAGANAGGSSGSGGKSAGGSSGSAGANAGGSSGQAAGGKTGSGGGITGDAAADVCPSCGPGEVCVESQIEGGPLILVDAGRCPNGRVPSAGPRPMCVLPPSYECKALPSSCTPPPLSPPVAHCICARSLCGSANLCDDISPTLMKCTEQVP